MKILLVEDSYIERRKLGAYLDDWGFQYQSVGSGTEAVKLLEAPEHPDICLLYTSPSPRDPKTSRMPSSA